MKTDAIRERLAERGIQPSAQRLAIADYVLQTHDHPSADHVWEVVRARVPMVSRATVYNTLNLFVQKKLLRELILAEGKVVFDPKIEPHHHFIDVDSGDILDVPWDAVDVARIEALPGFDVREYQVVMRGSRSNAAKGKTGT